MKIEDLIAKLQEIAVVSPGCEVKVILDHRGAVPHALAYVWVPDDRHPDVVELESERC
jgi:hypothetical protein